MLKKYAWVLGGNTHLGKHVIKLLKKKSISARWKTLSIDYEANLEANENHILDPTDSLLDQTEKAFEKAKKWAEEYDAIIVARSEGDFQTSNIKDISIFEKYEKLWETNTYTSMMAARIAGQLMAPCGLMMLHSSQEAFEKTNPNNLAVNLSKMEVWAIASNIAELKEV